MAETYGFELIEERNIPELNTHGKLYRHTATGAEFLSLENDDENKSFSIVFRTPPEDSTGIAHILEHSVLNGSQKYPVKEPFIELVKGSLQTFLNAFTYPDKTCYPFASQNVQDLYNLLDVYMDAVLHPLLPSHILDQEGWHYELENAEDPIIYKGVVFNEMKGAYSDPEGYLNRVSQHSLFPDTTYGVSSGGDPEVIPDLTYAQFKAFHENYYHPSNARIFWYGDDDPQERLRRLSEYLAGYKKISPSSSIPLQEKFEEARRITEPYAVAEGEDAKSMITLNWLLPENNDPERTLGLSMLSYILVSTPASPLRKALIDSGLGEDLVGDGIETELRQLTFSTGLKGIKKEDASKVEELIHTSLAALADEGIDPDMVAAALNTFEFRLRENNTGSFPRGLALMLRSMTSWLYDGDPFAPLAFEAPLQAVKNKIASGENYFGNLIKDHFIGNNHRTTVLLEPDPQLNRRKADKEAALLADVKSKMSSSEIESVIANTKKLQKIQETPDSPEALATLPMLSLDDIDKQNKTIPLDLSQEQGADILYHDLFTNGILYFGIGFDLHSVPQELLPYLDIFADGLVRMGTQTQDFVKLSQRIGQQTGGVSPSLMSSSIRGQADTAAWLMVSAKSTMDKSGAMLDLLKDILLTVKFDNRERFKQIVLENKSRLEQSLIPSGHSVVATRIRGKLSESGWLADQTGGISQIFFLRKLAEDIENDWVSVLQKLEQIRKVLFNRNAMLCNITLDQKNWQVFRPQLFEFLNHLPDFTHTPQTWERAADHAPEGLTIPSQVNYVGKGSNLYDLGYALHGSINVIQNYLRTTYMWEKIRVQGGAYGGMLSFDPGSGVFSYLSYRDPNLLETLENYDKTADYLRALKLSKDELTKSVIGAIGTMDSYQLPDAKGYTSMVRYLTKYSDADRQKFRQEIMSTNEQDFKAFAAVLDQVREHGLVSVLGAKEAIDEANSRRSGMLQIKKVM